MPPFRAAFVWACLACVVGVPLVAAALSPLLAWRDPIYILAGLAGVVAMALLLGQPLLAAGALPGLAGARGRRMHRRFGWALVAAVVVHVVGLWITSPPDVIDALVFASPTPFAPWGVVAMWALFATALVSVLRRRLRLRTWRIVHGGLAGVIVVGTVVHAVLIDGTMEPISKVALAALVVGISARVLWKLAERVRHGRLR